MSQSDEETADLDMFLDEARRFLEDRLKPLTSRHEVLITADQIRAITRGATELGLLPEPAQEPGFGLWERPDDATNSRFSLGMLELTAGINGGVAFIWHRYALAVAVARQTGLEISREPLSATLHPTGHYGLARGALTRWFARQIDDDDRTLLADWLTRRNHPVSLLAPHSWQQVIWPVWQSDAICWQRADRVELDVHPSAPQHGLNELAMFRAQQSDDGNNGPTADAVNYASALAADALGLVAIALGINEHGMTLAQDYARIRRQGGAVIGEHPAVQQMLADIRQAHCHTRILLETGALPVSRLQPAAALMLREHAHGRLCHAANQVMQLHGGIGYMQDCGPEKLLRDQNTLRAVGGGIRDIPLFIHAHQEVTA